MSGEREKKSHITGWVVALVLVPMLYMLSWGPVVYLSEKFKLDLAGNAAFWKFYAPLYWVEANTPLDRPSKLYRYWWYDLARKHYPITSTLAPAPEAVPSKI